MNPTEVISKLREYDEILQEQVEPIEVIHPHDLLEDAITTITELMADVHTMYQSISIHQIRKDIAELQKVNAPKKSVGRPKTKHVSEAQKIAEQRKKQMEEAVKAKDSLQHSLELDRLGSDEDEINDDEIAKAMEEL
jgi:hypothetical protein